MKKRQLILLAFLVSYSTLVISQSVNDTVKIKEVTISNPEGLKDLNQVKLKSLEASVDRNIGETLSRKTHLFVRSYGVGSVSTISMRGTGSSHTNLYWNNINLNSTTNGIADVSLYPGFFLDGLSLDQGLSSNLLGSGGLGGSVHFQSYASVGQPYYQISQTIGSFGLSTTTATFGFRNKKFSGKSKIYYSVADNDFEYQDLAVEGFPTKRIRNARYEQKGLMQTLNYQTKRGELSARFWWFDSDRNLPPFITIRENLENQKDNYLIGQLGYKQSIKKGTVEIQSSIKHTNLEYNNLQASIDAQSTSLNSSSLFILTKNLGEAFQFKSRLSFDYNTVDDESFDGNIDRQIISWYKHLKFYGFASEKYFKKWTAQISLRQEYLLNEDNFFIPTFQVSFQPKAEKEFYFFSKVGRNIKYPTLNDLYRQPFANPDLRVEKSDAAEVGAKWESRVGKKRYMTFTSVSLFYNDIEDYILWQPTIFGYWQPVNLEAVETSGIEFQQRLIHAAGKLKKEIQVLYSYTASINQNKLSRFDESEGKQLIYIPRNKVNINAILSYKKYQLAYSYQYISERFTSSDNTDQVDGFQLSDFTISKSFLHKKHQVDLSFSVLNIFNTSYQAIQWRPMPGRNYQLKINYQFKK